MVTKVCLLGLLTQLNMLDTYAFAVRRIEGAGKGRYSLLMKAHPVATFHAREALDSVAGARRGPMIRHSHRRLVNRV